MNSEKHPIPTADAVLIEDDKVLLIKRNHEPFVGFWVLPGGHIDYGETAETAVVREMKEETDLVVEIKKLIGVYSNPERDPRRHTMTIAYLVNRISGEVKIDHEATEFKFFEVGNLPEKMGFDHRDVVQDAIKDLYN